MCKNHMRAKTGKKRRRSQTGLPFACKLAQVKKFRTFLPGNEVFAQRNSLLLLLLLLPFSPLFLPGGNIDWRWMPSRYKSEEGEKYAENTDGTGVLKKGAASNKRIKKEKCKDIRCRRIILANSFWMQYFGWEVLSLHLILINSRTQPIGSSFPDRGWLSERSTII